MIGLLLQAEQQRPQSSYHQALSYSNGTVNLCRASSTSWNFGCQPVTCNNALLGEESGAKWQQHMLRADAAMVMYNTLQDLHSQCVDGPSKLA